MKSHHYHVNTQWTGNFGDGTRDYQSYGRDHIITVEGKSHQIHASSDPAFRGDAASYNPEELFVASLSACHMLWYLHLCAINGIVVVKYNDYAEGIMEESSINGGRFTRVILKPQVGITSGSLEKAIALHNDAHKHCFIANSCNFPIDHEPIVKMLQEF